jgi:hypothetical protein
MLLEDGAQAGAERLRQRRLIRELRRAECREAQRQHG